MNKENRFLLSLLITAVLLTSCNVSCLFSSEAITANETAEWENETSEFEKTSMSLFCPMLFGYSNDVSKMEIASAEEQDIRSANDPIIIRGQTETYWRTLDPYNPTYLAQATGTGTGNNIASQAPTLNSTNTATASTATPTPVPAADTAKIAPTISNTPFTPSVEKVMKFWNKFSFEYTYLARKEDLSMHEFDIATRFAIPCKLFPPSSDNQLPAFYIAPRFSFDLWNWDAKGPKIKSDTSDSLMDASIDFIFDAQYGDFGFEGRLALGIASSFSKIKGDAFYIRGRAMGKLVITEDKKITATAGLIYYDRNELKLLPSGGVIWQPNPANIWRIVFPDPMLSRHFGKYNDTDWWGYIRGDIGGGRWFMNVYDNEYANIDYSDYRVALGISFTTRCNVTGNFEVGGAFGRRFYGFGEKIYSPGSTVFLKGGVQF